MRFPLSVGITTRNRPESLRRCLASLRLISHLAPEVVVFDDGSEPAAAVADLDGARCIRDGRAPGYIAGRNRLVRESRAPYVLLLDDDAALVSAEAIERALDLLRADGRIAAVGFPPSASALPRRAGGAEARYVAAYTGFAHMLRRDAFLSLGGYRERFVFYGEEKEFCLRLLDAGWRVVRLTNGHVAHDPDPSGRSDQRYLRYVTRNDCLDALYNQPFARAVWLIPARLLLYFRMRRAWGVHDPFGWSWVLAELAANLIPVVRERQPVSYRTLRRWRALRDESTPYPVGSP